MGKLTSTPYSTALVFRKAIRKTLESKIIEVLLAVPGIDEIVIMLLYGTA
jgi:hypothetical protein